MSKITNEMSVLMTSVTNFFTWLFGFKVIIANSSQKQYDQIIEEDYDEGGH